MLGPILHTLSHALTDRVRRTFRRATRSESRLRVGVDIRPFYEPLTGIGWYLYHLLHEIAKRDDVELFLFGEPAYHSMWMKNTLIPLSVAFLDVDGRILNILDMEPQTLDTHTAAGPAVYAIETNKGWFAANKVKPGDKVTGLPGSGEHGRVK